MIHAILETPLCPLLAVAGPRGLQVLEFAGPEDMAPEHRLSRLFPGERVPAGEAPAIELLRVWLERYLAKDFAALPEVPLDLHGSAFERQVWGLLPAIQAGKTTTYGTIAEALRLGKAGARAVGAAVGRNPVGIVVPCHRVIGAGGKMVGYAGGLPRKRWLLHHEGFLLLPY